MPYKTTRKWVEPELFLEHKGVRVYNVYPMDDIDNDPSVFIYTLYNIEDLERNIDIRKLSTNNDKNYYGIRWNDIKDTIKRAIDIGELKIDERGLKEETIKKLKGEETICLKTEKLLTSSKH